LRSTEVSKKPKMKKLLGLFLGFLFIYSCGTKQDEVERHMEDGVEVVVNHLEPYQIKGELDIPHLEEELDIDTEYFHIARTGLTNIGDFDIDSKGNIYFLKPRKGIGNNIFKFDKSGRFITSFGPIGQGPGEFQYPYHFEIDNQDNIVVSDQSKNKLIFFNKDGSLIKEMPIDLGIAFVFCLDNGKFLTFGQDINTIRDEYLQFPLKLVNPQFEEIKDLDRYRLMMKRSKRPNLFCWSISNRFIYVGNEERGYEIWKYDLEGNLIQKIKNEYKKLPLSEEYKKERLERTPKMIRDRLFFPKFFPPYQAFFADNKGTLFVKTYEESENSGEFIYEIFISNGVFKARKSLNIWGRDFFLCAKTRQNLLYCLQEKESGYRELVVYKMRWENKNRKNEKGSEDETQN
jgi:hypothetical protein